MPLDSSYALCLIDEGHAAAKEVGHYVFTMRKLSQFFALLPVAPSP
jgi:hypothetical protein